ncbi:serine-rich adhesin for platelets-like [Homarus americanus]|uniref:serine-rich adhesin for platelets-like n=1 Tax=Homarus americanus TaxID=6706 RepID=UPI001C46200D|nr:serine-rich adhesin for platelets-like [Homarus americanus]
MRPSPELLLLLALRLSPELLLLALRPSPELLLLLALRPSPELLLLALRPSPELLLLLALSSSPELLLLALSSSPELLLLALRLSPELTTSSETQPRTITTTSSETQPRTITTSSETQPRMSNSSETQPRTTTSSESQSRTATSSETQPRTATSSEIQPKTTTSFETQSRTTSQTQPRTYTSSETQSRNTTSSETQPRTATSSETQPRTTTSSETQPRTATSSETQPRTATSSETQPRTTTSSETQPRTTTSSETQPRTATNSETQPRTTTSSETQPRTATNSETQPRTTTSSETQPRTTTSSETQPRTTASSETQSRTTTSSETQPRTTASSETQSRTTISSETQPRTTTSSETQPKTTPRLETQPRTTARLETQPRTATSSETYPRSTTSSETQPRAMTVSKMQPRTVALQNLTKVATVSGIQSKTVVPLKQMNTFMEPEYIITKPPGYINMEENLSSQINQERTFVNPVSKPKIESDMTPDENCTSVAQLMLPSTSCKYKDPLAQTKSITSDCIIHSEHYQNPVTSSIENTSKVSGNIENIKETRKEEEKFKQYHGEHAAAKKLERNFLKTVIAYEPEGKVEPKGVKTINREIAENITFEGFEDSNIEVKGRVNLQKLQTYVVKTGTDVLNESENFVNIQSLPGVSASDDLNTQARFKQLEFKSCPLLSQPSLQGAKVTDPCSSKAPSEKQDSKKLEYSKRESEMEESDRDESQLSNSAAQELDHLSKQQEDNPTEKNTIISVVTNITSSLDSKYVQCMRTDTSSSLERTETETSKFKETVKCYDVKASDLLKSKKREREIFEGGFSCLVLENMETLKKSKMMKTSASQKTSLDIETFLTDFETSHDKGIDRDELMVEDHTIIPQRSVNSPSSESKASGEESLLQKVREDWAQLSANPQWKWCKREKNKELWKFVMAAKARVNSKKVSQRRDSNSSTPSETHKCSLSGNVDEDSKDPQLAGTSGDVDQQMSRGDFAGFTTVQYMKGNMWKEGHPPQKKAKISDELCADTLTDNTQENFMASDSELGTAHSKNEVSLFRQYEKNPASTEWTTLSHDSSSSIQSKASELIMLEDLPIPDHHSTIVVDDGTTLDEAAVMRDPTTFGDLSYDYDLH